MKSKIIHKAPVTESAKVIIVVDSSKTRLGCQEFLKNSGYDVSCVIKGSDAVASVSQDYDGVIIIDLAMPGLDGLTVMEEIHRIDPEIPIIVITESGEASNGIKAIQEGAYDFLETPFSNDVLLEVVRRAMEKRKLVLEVRALRNVVRVQEESNCGIIGVSPSIKRLRQTINNLAGSDPDVLILGETGTGKDMVARCLHESSNRSKKNFVAINCGAIPESIIETELFGHEAGSFTGADKRRIGKFEYANGGTVFLDEIESMPLHLQVKLLHVLQDRVIYRVGSNEPIPVDIRIIAATKMDLKQASEENRFRKDLYYRLNVFELNLPPLRERMEDIPPLFNHFVSQIGWRYKVSVLEMPSRNYMHNLLSRKWEGNVRELKNEAEKYVLQLIMDLPETESTPQKPPPRTHPISNQMTLSDQMEAFERTLIEQELIRQKGDIKKTYLALGLPRQTLYYKIQKYGLNRKNYLSTDEFAR